MRAFLLGIRDERLFAPLLLSLLGMRPAEVWGWARNPKSVRAAMSLRIVAELTPMRYRRATVPLPTGSPVRMWSATTARRTSALRSPRVRGAVMAPLLLALSGWDC